MRVSSFDFDNVSHSFSDAQMESLKGAIKSSQMKDKLCQKAEAEKVAKEFEGMYLEMLLKSMRESVTPEEESNAEGLYKNMLDGEYAKAMSDSQSFGIRDMVYQWMTSHDPDLKSSE